MTFKPLNWDDPMPFGKYKYEKIGYLIDNHFSYIEWLLDNTKIEFDNDTYELIQEKRE